MTPTPPPPLRSGQRSLLEDERESEQLKSVLVLHQLVPAFLFCLVVTGAAMKSRFNFFAAFNFKVDKKKKK